ncbi:MAG: response regulator [Armatimonadetes bacterium]|nr:response regulator [Armatimonadota bacterium]
MPDRSPSPAILIVDDNPAAAKTLRLVLKTEGFEADWAPGASEALEMTTRTAYNAALIDIGLPGRSGIDLLGDLKARYPELVGIIVTGRASIENSIEALNRGASGYVQKPVDVPQLSALLRAALGKQRLEAENRRMLRGLSLLYTVGVQVGSGLEAQTTLQKTISLVTSLLDLPAGGIWWSPGANGEPRLAASVGLPPDLTDALTNRIADLRILSAADPKVHWSGWSDTEMTASTNGRPWRMRVIPLRSHEGTTGYMAIGGPDWTGDQMEEADVLSTVAWQVGVAMENMGLYEDLRVALERLTEAQAKVVQAEKLSAIGRVVSGIAHELNNPLAVILGYAGLIREGMNLDEATQMADRISHQAERAGKIIQELLSFCRQERTVLRPTDLRHVIEAALESTERLRSDRVQLLLALPEAMPTIAGDPGGLQQVLSNVIGNACQAMGEAGGVLTVAGHVADDTISLRVSDTGPGIPEDVLPRIFDPFFTTKGVGQGTGLGLSVSHGIVHDHGGEIVAGNGAQGGAVFTIRLPIREIEPLADNAVGATIQDAPWLQPTGSE